MSGKQSDMILACAQCGCRFYFTVGEQQFYKSKGLNIPKFCKSCRERKKEIAIKKEERRAAWVPRACSTCYFRHWDCVQDRYYCTRSNKYLANDAPCKYWTKNPELNN